MNLSYPNLVLFGPPGAGKSTQATLLTDHWRLTSISTGQRLRDTIEAQTDLGHEVAAVMAEGKLIDDVLMNRLLIAWLQDVSADYGVLLDGYPRTVVQARSLDVVLTDLERPLTAVVALVLSDTEAIRRLSGRRICRLPGQPDSIIHVSNEAAMERCLMLGGTLFEREDDQPEAITRRLAEYNAKTEPLLRFYAERNQLMLIDADDEPAAVSDTIVAALSAAYPELAATDRAQAVDAETAA